MTFGPKRTNPYRRSQGNNAWRVVRTTTYKFVAFENNTIIYRNGVSLATISAGGNSSLSLKAGDIITSNKYVSMTESGNGNTAMYSAWHGTRFAHRLERYNATLYFWNLFSPRETLTINISRGGTNITSVSLDGEWGSYNVGTTTGNYIFESDNGVRFSCIIGQFPTSDVMPLYPCDYKDEGPYELYGTASGSGDVIALEDNTSITEYTSAGGERTFTVNRGGNTALTSGGGQFAGSSVRLVADKPIYAFSIADGDGGEATPFVSPEAFGTHAAIPGSQNDFIKLVSNQPAVVNVNGTDRTLAGSNGIYQYYQTGSIPQGAILTSDTPFCAVYESDGNDETILSMWSQKNVKHVDLGTRIVTEKLALALDANNSQKTNFNISNLLSPYPWTVGTGSETFYLRNGTDAENERVVDTNPFGDTDIVWQSPSNDATSNADGGWGTSKFDIDTSKTYRFSIWVRKKTIVGDGRFYLGIHGFNSSGTNIGVIRRSNGTTSTNHYFAHPRFDNSDMNPTTSVNEWILVVGHVFPEGSGTGSDHPDSGIYETDGSKKISYSGAKDCVWNTGTTQTIHRSYQYYSTTTNEIQQWWAPRVDVCDGTEPTIKQLLAGVGRNWELTNRYTLDMQGAYWDTNHFKLDGTNEYMSIDRNWHHDEFTIEALVEFTTTNNSNICFNVQGQGLYPRLSRSGGNLFAQYRIDNTTQSITGSSLSTNTVYHVIFKHSPTTGAELWLNGTLDGSNSTTGNHDGGTSGTMNIGFDSNLNYYSSSKIYAFRLYSKALTAAEIKQNFNATRKRFGV